MPPQECRHNRRVIGGGSAVKLSDGHSLYFVTNGRGAGSCRSMDTGTPAGCGRRGLGSIADVSVAVARRLREDFSNT